MQVCPLLDSSLPAAVRQVWREPPQAALPVLPPDLGEPPQAALPVLPSDLGEPPQAAPPALPPWGNCRRRHRPHSLPGGAAAGGEQS